jgi:hypothetical protein
VSDQSMFAALSPKLLARKGGASPAMRPQFPRTDHDLQGQMRHFNEQLEDLGWNDMGEGPGEDREMLEPVSSPVAEALTSELEGQASSGDAPNVQRSKLLTVVGESQDDQRRSNQQGLGNGRRVSVSVRLDPDHHLRLRLACAIHNRSAQQIFSEALNNLLDEIPGLDDLTALAKQN